MASNIPVQARIKSTNIKNNKSKGEEKKDEKGQYFCYCVSAGIIGDDGGNGVFQCHDH